MKQWKGNGKNRLRPTWICITSYTLLNPWIHTLHWTNKGHSIWDMKVVVQEKDRCHIFHFLFFPTMQYTLNKYPRSRWNTNNCSFFLHSLAISSLFQASQIFLIWHFTKWEIIIRFKKVIDTNNLYLKCNFILHIASSAIPFSLPFYTNRDSPCSELLDNALGSASWLSP